MNLLNDHSSQVLAVYRPFLVPEHTPSNEQRLFRVGMMGTGGAKSSNGTIHHNAA